MSVVVKVRAKVAIIDILQISCEVGACCKELGEIYLNLQL